MGFQLRREVRDALPPGILTAAERLLVLELADMCRDDTRECWPGSAKLAELTDLSERSIQEALSRIGKKWIELRVPLGKSDTGKVYYSHAGRRTTFRFPRLPRREGATDRGSSGATDPGSSGPEGATDPGGRCDGSVQKVRQIRGPFPQRTTQKSTTPPPTPSDDLEVVDGEIVEEGEASTSSLEPQIQNLIDEAVAAKPNWRRKRQEIRDQIDALLLTFGGNFDLACQVVRETALAADSGFPARITLAQNPAMVRANARYLIAEADARPEPAFGVAPHPQAHAFEAKPESRAECQHCPFPEPNQRHRVPKPRNARAGSFGEPAAVDGNSPPPLPGRHQPFRNPPMESYYGDW